LRQLAGVSWNAEADALTDKIGTRAVEPDRASIAMSVMALVDRFQYIPGLARREWIETQLRIDYGLPQSLL
jgi:hypothetical protein